MIFFGNTGSGYKNALISQGVGFNTIVQLLDNNEAVTEEISANVCHSTAPQLTAGSENGQRRSLNISFFNTDEKYTPSKKSPFWYCRKFRLLEAAVHDKNTYLQPLGTFLTSKAEISGGIITVSAADKFSALNGELKTGICGSNFSTDISSGDIYIAQFIREILSRQMGNSTIFDPVAPLIDPYFESQKLYSDIVLGAGQTFGDILITLADMFGTEVFYDRFGRLNFIRKPNWNIPSGYDHSPVIREFSDDEIIVGSVTEHRLDGYNKVSVSTDNTEGEVYSYTAENNNPQSPLCISAVGERWADEPVRYIPLGDTTLESGEEKCRQYAEFLLLKSTANTVSESFQSKFIPHLETGKMILYKGEYRLVTSFTADLAAYIMQVSACSTQFLPNNFTVQV